MKLRGHKFNLVLNVILSDRNEMASDFLKMIFLSAIVTASINWLQASGLLSCGGVWKLSFREAWRFEKVEMVEKEEISEWNLSSRSELNKGFNQNKTQGIMEQNIHFKWAAESRGTGLPCSSGKEMEIAMLTLTFGES